MAMSRVPVVAGIIKTRVNQVVDFSRRVDDPHKNGWLLRLRDPRKSPTKAALSSMDKLAEVIARAGGDFQPDSSGFEGFLSAVVRDTLTYDQVNFEVLFARHLKRSSEEGAGRLPVGFVYVDPSTIRRAKPSEQELARGRWNPKGTSFVQVLDDKVVNEYDQREMAFGIRNVRSWVHARGYGHPELEILMGVVANLLKAETWNAKKFTTGIRSDQMITLSSDMSAEMFEAVRRIVWAMLSGTSNNQRVPLLQLSPDLKEELKVHTLGHTASDMQFKEWINFLIKICCALYQMDPAELGFVFGNEGQSSSLNSQGPAERIAASKERGLHPLLRSVARWLNQMIVWQWDPDFELAFCGYDDMTQKDRQELDTGAIKHYRSPNEVRASMDEEPMELMAGDINLLDLPLDATLINAALSLGQQGEEGEGGGPFGGLGGGGDDGGGGGQEGAETEEGGGGEPKGTEEVGETEETGKAWSQPPTVTKGGGIRYRGNVPGADDDLLSVIVQRYEERSAAIQSQTWGP
jgi:uncharacterized membrane protein YgcG